MSRRLVSQQGSVLAAMRSPRLPRFAGWIAGLALLFQAFIPLIHMPPASRDLAGIPAWELASICHTDLAPPTGRDEADHSKQPGPNDSSTVCPICLGLAIAGTFVPPTIVILPTPIMMAKAGFFASQGHSVRLSHRRLTQPRAPPIS